MTFLYAFFYIVSRVLGLIRNQLMLAYFGVLSNTIILDAYYAAFKIPDFIFNVIFIGAITTVFIPLFIKYNNQSEEKAKQFTADMLKLVSLIFFILCLFCLIFIDFLVSIIAPGFEGDKYKLTVQLSTIMIFSPLIFAISSIFGSVCNIFNKVIYMALAPVFYNLGIIFGILFLSPFFSIYGVAFGVILGAFLHLIIHFVGAFDYIKNLFQKKYFKITLISNEIKHASIIAIPRIITLISMQLMVLFETIWASFLPAGSVSHFYIADNINNLPVGVIGLTLSVLGFPILSKLATKNDILKLNDFLKHNFIIIGFFTIPITILTFLYSKDILAFIFVHGKFNMQDLEIVYQILLIFSISFLIQSLLPIISKTFYSFEDTKTPMWITFFVLFLNLFLLWFLISVLKMGILALPLAYVLSVYVQFILMVYFLYKKSINIIPILNIYLKFILVSFLAAILTYIPIYFKFVNINLFISFVFSIFFIFIYLFLVHFLIENIFNILNKKYND